MHKIDVDNGNKTLIEAKDLKSFAFDGLIAKGNTYSGVCSNNGIRVKSIKGKCLQEISGGVVSPENPVEIQTVSIGKIASFGKNFAKGVLDAQCTTHTCTVSENDNVFTIAVTGSDAYFGEVISVGQSRSGNEGKLFSAIPGKKIYFKSMNGVFDKSYIQQWDENLTSLGFLDAYNPNGKDLAAGTKYISLRIGIAGSVAGTTYTDKIMLSFDPITEWEEPYYEEKSVSYDLYGLLDGTCDEVRDGKLIRRVAHAHIDGDTTIARENNAGGRFKCMGFPDRVDVPDVTPELCNRLKPHASSPVGDGMVENTIRGYYKGNSVFIKMSQFSTVSDFKSWLATHPIDYFYKLRTPIVTPIIDLIIPTQAPYTTIAHDSPIETEVEYEILTKSDYAAEIIDIKQRLAALESAALE